MPVPLSQQAMDVAANATFQSRVKFFLQKAALDVMAEVNTTPNHTARVVFANKVLAGQTSIFEATVAVLTNTTVEGELFTAPDNDVQFAVNSVYNALAGVAT